NDDPLQIRQRFAAETALIAANGKGTASVVVVPPRDWDPTGKATAQLAASLSQPWISQVTVSQIVAATPAPPAVNAPATGRQNGTLDADQLNGIKQLDQATSTLGDLLADRQQLPESMLQALLRTASLSWRGFPEESKRFAAIEAGSVNVQLGK